jgi:type I restriction enzyme M protein
MRDAIPFDTVISRAIDRLRGQMLDDGSIGQYLLALLIVKYASDFAPLSHASSSVSLFVPDTARFEHLLQNARQPGNANRIEDALLRVEMGNAALVGKELRGSLFRHKNGDSSHEINRALGNVIELFSRGESLNAPHARKTELMERILALLADSRHGRAGQFYTPRAITKAMVDILSPKSGERVYDPVCGTGGFFVGALNHVRKENASSALALFGQEPSPTVARIAALNLLLHDADNRNVYAGDALMQPIGAGFDIVVSNPPFSETRADLGHMLRGVFDRFAPGVPPPSRADYAFVLRMLASLKPGTGRMAVIMPPGALFRGGSEREIRRHLIERNLLDTVIALPPKIFIGTAIPTVVMVFRQGREDDCVLFIDASEDFEPGRKWNVLRDEHIQSIVEAFRNRIDVPRYARLASRAEIKANNFNLSLSRYFDRGASFEAANPEELSARESMLRAELADLQRQIEGCLNELHLRKE